MCAHGKKCGPAVCGYWLVIIGALNWGLVGLGGFLGNNWDVINLIFGSVSWLANLIYLVIGISGIMMIVGCKSKKCKGGSCCDSSGNDSSN